MLTNLPNLTTFTLTTVPTHYSTHKSIKYPPPQIFKTHYHSRLKMAAFSMDIPMKAVNVCEAFARGECQFGQNCAKDHPPQLSPGCQREVEFEFSRDHFTGCERCVTQGFPVCASSISHVDMLIVF